MNTSIKTNKLKPIFQFEKIDEQFDVFQIETSNKYFDKGSSVLDEPFLNNNVMSVQFTYGRSFYILMRKRDNNFVDLKSLFEQNDDITIKTITSKVMPRRILLQLLINALNASTHPLLKSSNLTGHYYCFCNEFMAKSKKEGQSTTWQIKTIEISVEETIDKELVILLPVKTFTNLKNINKLNGKKSDILSLPQYVIGTNNTLRRKLDKDSNVDTYVLRQLKKKKSRVCFLDISCEEKFAGSKMGILQAVISLFNMTYEGLVKITFDQIGEVTSLKYSVVTKKAEREVLIDVIDQLKINLIDEVKNEESAKLSKNIIALLANEFKFKGEEKNIEIKQNEHIGADCLNIRLIHNAYYYEEDEYSDPYKQDFGDCIVQHVTLEDFDGTDNALKTRMSVVLQELIIKKDLKSKQITCFNWPKLKFSGDYFFYASHGEDENQQYFEMKITPEGFFSIIEFKEDLLSLNKYSEIILILKKKKKFDSDVYVIENPQGERNIIKETKKFTIPEIDLLYEELKNGNNKLRNKESKDKMLSAILDIGYIANEDKACYFVGIIGDGMQSSIPVSCHVHSVTSADSQPLFFEDILPLMNVSFVKNSQLTVIPFPFKYMREYIQSCVKKQPLPNVDYTQCDSI